MYGNRSDYEIRYDYQLAQKQAERLRETARELRMLMNDDYENILIDLARKWQGDSADVFMKKSEIVKNNIIQTALDMERTADTIISTAQRLYNAEMKAKQIAEEREY